MTEKKEKSKKVGMGAFDIREMTEEGVRLPLSLPDGTPTDEFIIVLGADSATFRDAQARGRAMRLKMPKEDKDDLEKMAALTEGINRSLVASLVSGWSFEEPCTQKAVEAFFISAPQIQTQIDLFSGNQANFFKRPSKG